MESLTPIETFVSLIGATLAQEFAMSFLNRCWICPFTRAFAAVRAAISARIR